MNEKYVFKGPFNLKTKTHVYQSWVYIIIALNSSVTSFLDLSFEFKDKFNSAEMCSSCNWC